MLIETGKISKQLKFINYKVLVFVKKCVGVNALPLLADVCVSEATDAVVPSVLRASHKSDAVLVITCRLTIIPVSESQTETEKEQKLNSSDN